MRTHDPKEKLTAFTWCAASHAHSHYPSADPNCSGSSGMGGAMAPTHEVGYRLRMADRQRIKNWCKNYTYRRKSPHETQSCSRRPRGIELCRRHRRPEHPDGASTRYTQRDRKSTRLNSSHLGISYAVFCLKK